MDRGEGRAHQQECLTLVVVGFSSVDGQGCTIGDEEIGLQEVGPRVVVCLEVVDLIGNEQRRPRNGRTIVTQ